MYAPRGREGGGLSLSYISIAYYMQKGGEGVRKVCKNAYVINGRPPTLMFHILGEIYFHQVKRQHI